jgi:hypothetical protein
LFIYHFPLDETDLDERIKLALDGCRHRSAAVPDLATTEVYRRLPEIVFTYEYELLTIRIAAKVRDAVTAVA